MRLGYLTQDYAEHSRSAKPIFGVQVNPQHPLSEDLGVVALLNECSGSYLWNTVDHARGIVTGAQRFWSEWGEGFKFNYYSGGGNKNDRIILPPYLPTKGVTVEIWCELTGGELQDQKLFYMADMWGTEGYLIMGIGGFRPDTDPHYWKVVTTEGTASTAFTIPYYDDRYHLAHVVCIYDGKMLVAYVNGKQAGTPMPLEGSILWSGSPPDNMILGNIYGAAAQAWNGRIYSLKVWGRGLSQTEVGWLYEQPYSMLWYPGESLRPIIVGLPPAPPPSTDTTPPPAPASDNDEYLAAFWHGGYFGIENPEMFKMFRWGQLVTDQTGFRVMLLLVDHERSTFRNREIVDFKQHNMPHIPVNRKARLLQYYIRWPDEDVPANLLELTNAYIPISER